MNHFVGCRPDAPLANPLDQHLRLRPLRIASTAPYARGDLVASPLRRRRIIVPPGGITRLHVCSWMRAPHVVLVTFDPDTTLERLLGAPASCMVLTHGPGIGGRNRMATLQAQAALDARKPLLLAFVDLDDALRARSWLEVGR